MLNFSSEEVMKHFWKKGEMVEMMAPGHQLGEVSLLFQNIEDEAIQRQLEKLEAAKMANQVIAEKVIAAPKAEVTFDDFSKIDLRIATILEAQKVPKTDKLMQLLVDTGMDQRTIVSGIAHQYSPEDLVGKQIMVLCNLAPRKLKGIESKGMILLAKDPDENLIFVSPLRPTTNGSEVA
jgi:methionyl-tRNA synthetase